MSTHTRSRAALLLLLLGAGSTACRIEGTSGNECTPRGPMLTLEGTIELRAHGKGTGVGVWLETDDEEEWILSYGARRSLSRLDGTRVTVRGRACDPHRAALMGKHLALRRASVVRRAPPRHDR